MFKLKSTVARNSSAELDDSAAVKLALTSLGYYDDSETGLSPYGDNQLFTSIKAFQKDNDLKVDGILHPDGPTHTAIKEKLSADSKAGNVFMDFKRNFDDMNATLLPGGDKYFHCKANYEASERGWDGWVAAKIISDERETFWAPKNIFKSGLIEAIKDSAGDQAANKHGRSAARSGKYSSAQEACAIYRPSGLDDKY